MIINNDPKQSLWELWFVISIIWVITIFMIGMLPNSKINFPHWDICAVLCSVNCIFCAVVGCKK